MMVDSLNPAAEPKNLFTAVREEEKEKNLFESVRAEDKEKPLITQRAIGAVAVGERREEEKKKEESGRGIIQSILCVCGAI